MNRIDHFICNLISFFFNSPEYLRLHWLESQCRYKQRFFRTDDSHFSFKQQIWQQE